MRLDWDAVGERYYEVGVDRGVLYVGTAPGVPWNGLVSVNEEPSGGEPTPYYLDGVKYLNEASTEEFEATIEAYTYPKEFDQCDGTKTVSNGLFSTQQKRVPFNLAYRTLIGNDVDGVDHGYKIHLVYNALVSPSSRSNATMGESVDPSNFSWKITTQPISHAVAGLTSHLVIDSRDTPEALLEFIEFVLYGSDSSEPSLPNISAMHSLFSEFVPLVTADGAIDALHPWTFSDVMYDGGNPPSTLQTSTIDGGGA